MRSAGGPRRPEARSSGPGACKHREGEMPIVTPRPQPRERQFHLHPALRGEQLVPFVHDHRVEGREDLVGVVERQEDGERLRRRHERGRQPATDRDGHLVGRVLADSAYQEKNMIAAGNLLPQKAALLLSLALARTADLHDIQRMFDEY